MKMISKKGLASVMATSAIALSALAPMANADVSASAGVVSDYYFRGVNLGDAGAYGSVEYSAGGFTAGTWWIDDGGLGGNDGMENDWYVSYGGGSDSFNWNVGYTRYAYTYTGDFEQEVSLGLGFGAFSIGFAAGEDEDKDIPWVSGDTSGVSDVTDDYTVITVGLELGAFSATAGRYDADEGGEYDWAELSFGGDIVESVSASINIGKAFASGIDTDGYMYVDVSKSF